MNEDHIIRCFKDTLDTGDGHILREDGEYARNAAGDVILLDYSRYQKLVQQKKHLFKETQYIPKKVRRLLNKIGRIFNWHSNWDIDHYPVHPTRFALEGRKSGVNTNKDGENT